MFLYSLKIYDSPLSSKEVLSRLKDVRCWNGHSLRFPRSWSSFRFVLTGYFHGQFYKVFR